MMTRYLSSAPIGLAVTLGLMYAMHILIEIGNAVPTDPVDPHFVTWVAAPREEKLITVDDLPPPLPEVVTPPSSQPPTDIETDGKRIHVAAPPADPGPSTVTRFEPSVLSDGPLVQVILVQPQYPPIAISRGVEGYVTVLFDVMTDGTVTNVIAIDSSHGMLEAAAIRAARKFRFKPKVIDGVPMISTGVSYRFRFELED